MVGNEILSPGTIALEALTGSQFEGGGCEGIRGVVFAILKRGGQRTIL